jgi:hypothetical protein
MIEKRNPFKLRASEYIESDIEFLRLFSPGVIDILPKDNIWKKIQIFQSAPGGGKTSLFRVFTPSSLITLYNNRTKEDYLPLYKKMKGLGVISENGPNLLGVMISCARNYSMLEDLNLDQKYNERLFYSLLNVRLILATMRGALTLNNLSYPDDLDHITIRETPHNDIPTNFPIPGTGKEIFEWARTIEDEVCKTINSFVPTTSEVLTGHDTLYALSIIQPGCIKCDGKIVSDYVLVMLDDVQKLTTQQRKMLKETLRDERHPISIWVSERLEALRPNELLTLGTTTERDINKSIILEDFWRSSSNSKRYENLVIDIANRRSKFARDFPISSFEDCLLDNLDGLQWIDRYNNAINDTSKHVKSKVSLYKKYGEWINDCESFPGAIRQKAINWKVIEILIERDLRKVQQTLDTDLILQNNDLEQKKTPEVLAAAEFFISQEFNIPYYFGISRLSTLASSNIEQFLAMSGELFESYISASLLKRQATLTPDKQELILKNISLQWWGDLPKQIPNGKDVKKFLESINQCAQWETYKPNAPYAPGVTGIAISMNERDKLLNPNLDNNNDRLLSVLSSCISYNLLEVALDIKQGRKTWMVLYLNRWLCLQFKLPLQYGGWRQKSLDELCNWLDYGFKPPERLGRRRSVSISPRD